MINMSLWKPVMKVLSPAGGRGKLVIFIFHRVLSTPDPLLPGEPDGIQFEWMVRLISRSFTVLPFGTAVEMLKRGQLPSAAACITFDDGYRDNFLVALPILRKHGVSATFFVATGFLDGGRMWNDDILEALRGLPPEPVDWTDLGLGKHDISSAHGRLSTVTPVLRKLMYFPHREREAVAREIARRAGVADRSELMMTADEVRGLRAAGMEVGGHTHSHPILSGIGDEEAFSDILRGKTELEGILSEPVNVFAYPNGNPRRDLDFRHVEMLKRAGFVAAATTEIGIARAGCDPFLLPRFTPWDRSPEKFGARCALALVAG